MTLPRISGAVMARRCHRFGGTFFGLCAAILMIGCQSSQQSSVKASNPPAATGQPKPVASTKPDSMFGPKPMAQKPGLPTINAKAAILIDHRGKVLFEKNADLRLPTASTQKLLLGILVAESGGLDRPITVSQSDTQCEPTKMGLRAGQTYKKGELLKAVLIRSSNDIARCLARDHSGSVPAFAQSLNARARQLGMKNSYFTNASGLPTPGGQFSTARDMAILGHTAMRYPSIRDAVGTKAMVFRFANGTTKTIYNTNQVLKGNPYCNGCKTGFTNAAGRCLVSSASDGRRSVIAVILGSKTPDVWVESDGLLRYGLTH